MIKACCFRNFPPSCKTKANLTEKCTLQTSWKIFDYFILKIFQVFELFGMHLCVYVHVSSCLFAKHIGCFYYIKC